VPSFFSDSKIFGFFGAAINNDHAVAETVIYIQEILRGPAQTVD